MSVIGAYAIRVLRCSRKFVARQITIGRNHIPDIVRGVWRDDWAILKISVFRIQIGRRHINIQVTCYKIGAFDFSALHLGVTNVKEKNSAA